jgi:hypothetical protein
MSTKTTFKRIALVTVAALGFGVLTSVAPASAVSTAAAPWDVSAAQSVDATTQTAITATQIAGASNFVEINATTTSTSTSSVLKVSGSTITVNDSTNGTLNAAATEIVFVGAVDATNGGDTVQISAATAGTVTAKWYTRVVLNGVPTDTLAQTITFTVSAVKTWSTRYSTATAAKSNSAGVAGTGETILAPQGTLNAATAVLVGTVTMSFKDEADNVLSTPTGKFPAVRATITTTGSTATGPGNISFDGGTTKGRDISLTTAAQAPVISIYNDGIGGNATVSIYVDGTLWKTKAVSFYGTVTTLKVTQGLFVAPTTGGNLGCGSVTATCTGTTIALTPAATLTATDINNVAVPFLTIGASSSDTAVFSSSTVSAETVATGTGSYNANVYAVPAGTSGKTAAVTFRTLLADGVTYVSASALTYAIGGAATAVTLEVASSGKAGEKASFKITKKDSAGNKAYDAIHTVAFLSNTSVTSSIFDATANTQTAGSSQQMIVNGEKEWAFFNPLVDAEVVFDVTVSSGTVASLGGGGTASAKFSVSTTSQAAVDAAQEATDAANAATDAANAAAEAADAATAAAQDAADAVAALSTQVAAMISALKKQITALTNLIIKIQKKVKA